MGKLMNEFKSMLKTWFFFTLACWLIPILCLSYICLYMKEKLWINFLYLRYPRYEISTSKKIRTLIDTPRNAGIFHFLLQLQGPCDFEQIKENYLNHIIDRRNKSGELRYPKLRKKLISCWGHYAWVNDHSDFDINNHVILSPGNYRGRPVSESNIQEFVSELVAKYIPSEVPQWQIIVIPAISTSASTASESEQSENESYYILVRVHHLIIAEEDNLHISEILMMNPERPRLQIYDSTLEDSVMEMPKLSDFVERPKHIPKLWNHILMTISNRWNQFIYHYDPLEMPDMDKKQQITSISQLISIFFITIVTVGGDFLKDYKKTDDQIKYKMRHFINLYRREAYKRNINMESVFSAFFNSMNPVNVTKSTVGFIWKFTFTVFILSPLYAFLELMALKDILLTGHTPSTGTIIGSLSIYLPLIYCAIFECFSILKEIIEAPRNIFEELFQHKSKEGNILQIKSYSGRKVATFSKSISMEEIRQRINLNEIGEIEYILSCLAGSLYKYLQGFDHKIPSMLNATCRCISKKYFTEISNKSGPIGGVIFLQLPLQEPNKQQINNIRKIIDRVQKKQISIYLLSLAQTKCDLLTSMIPEVWMKIFINFFSIAYPVTITEIHGDSSQMETIWGQEVKDILLFRPPQSKTCLSLNIHRFGDKSRLAVMADTQLAPDYSKISTYWENFMENATIN